MTPLSFHPPHNIEAEQALLGAILLDNAHYGTISGALGPDDFFEPLHSHVLHQAGLLIATGKKATPVTLKDSLPTTEIARGVTLPEYLARLMAEGTTSALEIETYVNRVRELSKMRGIIGVADELRRSGTLGNLPEGALADAWDHLDAIRIDANSDSDTRGSVAELGPLLLAPDKARVVPSGLIDLDRAIAGGWRAGRLYIAAGRPGMGKTILGVAAARRAARKMEGVSIFSLEIDVREMMARLVADQLSSSHFPIPYRDIVAGQLDDAQHQRVADAIQRLGQYPLRIDTTGGLTMTQIEARARIDRDRFLKAGSRLALVVIDYLGLVRASERYRGQKVQEMGEIALAGKTMAKRLDCAVLMLAQLNRQVESRDDKRPQMSDLRDSGNIEEHADFVGLVYRPFYYIERSEEWRVQSPEAIDKGLALKERLELIIGKNRLGGTSIVELWCEPSLSAIDNLSRHGGR